MFSLQKTQVVKAKNDGSFISSIITVMLSEYLVLLLCLLYFVIMALFEPKIASGTNMLNIFSSMLPLLLLAVGQTFVLIIGGIDLSIPSIVSLVSVVGASIMSNETGYLAESSIAVPIGVIAMFAVGSAIGWINGISVTTFHMPPFIVTLTMMLFVGGAAIWYAKSTPIYGLPDAFTAMASDSVSVLFVVAVTICAHFLLNHSLFGKRIFAIGTNEKAALISGIPVNRSIIWVYIISGSFAVMGSILLTAQLETGSPVLGEKMLLDVVGAVIIGGTSLFGGKGKIIWTVFGVLFITLIDNSLNLMNFSYFTIMMVKGAFILFAALIDSLRKKARHA